MSQEKKHGSGLVISRRHTQARLHTFAIKYNKIKVKASRNPIMEAYVIGHKHIRYKLSYDFSPFRRCHKKHVPSTYPPMESVSSQRLMILRRSVWPAGARNLFLGGALQYVHRAPRKSAKARIRLEGLCMHHENWARIARTGFSLDARIVNRQTEQTERNTEKLK